ncbi:MAG: PGF-CTERM sorting domain-containing protein [Haloplanus sp.]
MSKDGYYEKSKSLLVDGDVTNTFAVKSGSVTVEFTVVDPHFDPPEAVQDAKIQLSGIGTLTTLRSGEASTRVPVNTEIEINVTKSGYGTASRRLQIEESDEQVSLSISRVPSLHLESTNQRVVAGERVVVTVTDQYGDPVEGATITLDGETAGQTNADGQLAVRVDDPGSHVIAAKTGRISSNSVRVEAISGDTATPTPTTASPTPTPTATPTATPVGTTTETGLVGPGFTPALAVLALLAAAFLLRRR